MTLVLAILLVVLPPLAYGLGWRAGRRYEFNGWRFTFRSADGQEWRHALTRYRLSNLGLRPIRRPDA